MFHVGDVAISRIKAYWRLVECIWLYITIGMFSTPRLHPKGNCTGGKIKGSKSSQSGQEKSTIFITIVQDLWGFTRDSRGRFTTDSAYTDRTWRKRQGRRRQLWWTPLSLSRSSWCSALRRERCASSEVGRRSRSSRRSGRPGTQPWRGSWTSWRRALTERHWERPFRAS